MISISLFYCWKKVVYSYEYMDEWEKFIETSLSQKEKFYSNLNMKNITDADYMHAIRVCKYFEIKKFVWISWYVF